MRIEFEVVPRLAADPATGKFRRMVGPPATAPETEDSGDGLVPYRSDATPAARAGAVVRL